MKKSKINLSIFIIPGNCEEKKRADIKNVLSWWINKCFLPAQPFDFTFCPNTGTMISIESQRKLQFSGLLVVRNALNLLCHSEEGLARRRIRISLQCNAWRRPVGGRGTDPSPMAQDDMRWFKVPGKSESDR